MELFLLRKNIAVSAEIAQKTLSPAVLQPGSEFRGKKIGMGLEVVEPQQEACFLHPVSCCGWKLRWRCHWSMGWDGRKITDSISAGEKSFVIRIKPYSCQSCYFFSAFLLLGASCITHSSEHKSSVVWGWVTHPQECGQPSDGEGQSKMAAGQIFQQQIEDKANFSDEELGCVWYSY